MLEILDHFGLLEGTTEVRARGWALFQAVSGYLSMLSAIYLLANGRFALRMTSNLDVTYRLRLNEEGHFYMAPVLLIPTFLVETETFIPRWDAWLNIILGCAFLTLGIYLNMAIYEKSSRKCQLWLQFTGPIIFIIIARSAYKTYSYPTYDKLFNIFVGIGLFYAYNVIDEYRDECIEFERMFRIFKEREMD